jgi:hypothetical protein
MRKFGDSPIQTLRLYHGPEVKMLSFQMEAKTQNLVTAMLSQLNFIKEDQETSAKK